MGFTATAVRAAGFTAKEMRAANFELAALSAAHFTAKELRRDFLTLIAAGFPTSELRVAGFFASFSALELREPGYTANKLGGASKAIISPGPKEAKDVLLKIQDLASEQFQRQHGIWKLSGNKLAKIKYSEFQQIFLDFEQNEAWAVLLARAVPARAV